MRKILFLLAVMCGAIMAFGQETDGQINPNSLIPIPKYEQLYKVRVWRDIDLREKQNKGFFARGGEITKLLIQAVNSGELADIYQSDSLTAKRSKEDFLSGLVSLQGESYDPWNPTFSYFGFDRTTYNGKTYEAILDNTGQNPETSSDTWVVSTAGNAVYFLPNELYKMTMLVDEIFDKRRSRWYHDIQAIQWSAFDLNTGTFRPLGWFKYKDLEAVFRNHPDEAVWFNRQNSAENKNFGDAFLLGLFHSTIEKRENPDNETIMDTYMANGRPYAESVWAREWMEMELMEREHNLWVF